MEVFISRTERGWYGAVLTREWSVTRFYDSEREARFALIFLLESIAAWFLILSLDKHRGALPR